MKPRVVFADPTTQTSTKDFGSPKTREQGFAILGQLQPLLNAPSKLSRVTHNCRNEWRFEDSDKLTTEHSDAPLSVDFVVKSRQRGVLGGPACRFGPATAPFTLRMGRLSITQHKLLVVDLLGEEYH